MTEPIPDGLMVILRHALEQQMAQADPPEVAAALDRFRTQGTSEAEAWRLLSSALLVELERAKSEGQPLDRGTYADALGR